ncbi:MAG: glycerophosphodiester phosphodiesterase family protein [Pseudomarimonas sp.]
MSRRRGAAETASDALQRRRVIVIAHRGASGERPEHTLAAYRLAIEQGADFIEPDLVPTRDGVLIARHENELSGTTDVAAHPEFADRHTHKCIDGEPVDGWFSEDFTLAEIKTLRARERIPQLRPRNTQYDGQESIPTLAEILDLVRGYESRGRSVGIYPETKHPTWFASEGRRLDGEPIHRCPGQMLVDQLVASGFTDSRRVFIQSFEVGNLLQLSHEILPAAGLHMPLILLIGDIDSSPISHAFAHPYDVQHAIANQLDLETIYGGLPVALGRPVESNPSFSALTKPAVLGWLRSNGIAGIGPWKDNLLQRTPISPAPLASQLPKQRLTGAMHPLLNDALAAGLDVHPYTLRAEPAFLVADENGATMTMEQELRRLLDAGITGFFTDHSARGVAERNAFIASSPRAVP